MESITENALKNLIDAYANYLDKSSKRNKFQLPQDLLGSLKPSEKERLLQLFKEFNAERLQKLKDNVVIAANDFVRFYENHPLFAD